MIPAEEKHWFSITAREGAVRAAELRDPERLPNFFTEHPEQFLGGDYVVIKNGVPHGMRRGDCRDHYRPVSDWTQRDNGRINGVDDKDILRVILAEIRAIKASIVT